MFNFKNIYLSLAFFCGCCGNLAIAAEVIDINVNNLNDPRVVLEELKVKVNKAFGQMEKELAVAAKELSTVGLRGEEAKKILNKLYGGKKYVVDVVTIDLNGTIVNVVPQAFEKHIGDDISQQPQFIHFLETKEPVLSDVFFTIEGINAIDFEYPVFSEENEFLGAVSMLIKYEEVFSPLILPVVTGGLFDAWIIQEDGLTLYDPDKEEIGRNVFDDPMYKTFPSYVALCRRISQEESGFGSYNFLNKGLSRAVNKDAAWTTIGVRGAQWRMVVVQERKTLGGE